MRYVGLDVGDRRIGVALSDATGLIASAIGNIERADDDLEWDLQKTADKNTEACVSFLYDHLCVMHASAVCILWIITHQYCINGMYSSDVFHALQAAV